MDDELTQIREKRKKELAEKMRHTEKVANVANIEEMHFQEFISTHPFVVMDFWAEWCGPCRRIVPIMEDLSKEFAGKVTFAKCNTDDNRRLATQFNISAIPAIMLFSHGQLVERIIGAHPKEAIREKIIRKFPLG